MALAAPVAAEPLIGYPNVADVASYRQHLQDAWPKAAFEHGIENTVRVNCRFTVQGSVDECVVVAIADAKQPAFAEAALKVLDGVKFVPAKRDGEPLEVRFDVDLAWRCGAACNPAPRPALQRRDDAYTRMPTQADLDRVYPATGAGVVGEVILVCTNGSYQRGRLTDTVCSVNSEKQKGRGFAEAALSLSNTFRSGAMLNGDPFVVLVKLTPPGWSQPPAFDILATPSPAQVAMAYPTAAAVAGIDKGQVILTCTVQAFGRLERCSAKAVTGGGDFSAAALKLAPLYRVGRWSLDGRPTAGATFTATIDFESPASRSPNWRRTDAPELTGAEVEPLNAAILERYYPERALSMEKGGVARVVCVVGIDDSVSDCALSEESPAGFGFGAAAMKISQTFKARAARLNGVPVQTKAAVPINFALY